MGYPCWDVVVIYAGDGPGLEGQAAAQLAGIDKPINDRNKTGVSDECVFAG